MTSVITNIKNCLWLLTPTARSQLIPFVRKVQNLRTAVPHPRTVTMGRIKMRLFERY